MASQADLYIATICDCDSQLFILTAIEWNVTNFSLAAKKYTSCSCRRFFFSLLNFFSFFFFLSLVAHIKKKGKKKKRDKYMHVFTHLCFGVCTSSRVEFVWLCSRCWQGLYCCCHCVIRGGNLMVVKCHLITGWKDLLEREREKKKKKA